MARATTTNVEGGLDSGFTKSPLPPDPDAMNHELVPEIDSMMVTYANNHGLQRDEALVTVLTGLMHVCDRDTRYGDFSDQLETACAVYEESTRGPG